MIAITGRPGDEVRRRALEAGCEQCFLKPLDPAALEELLASA
jgi:CheY-like chemotaxis protein